MRAVVALAKSTTTLPKGKGAAMLTTKTTKTH